MSTPFIKGGPPRFKHQERALAHLIKTRGVTALLMDPGTGKTATTLDYLSLLAAKAETGEVRVLVVAPLAAVDTWVLQAQTYVSPMVNVWAEVLGGSILEKAETLAARGGQPFKSKLGEPGMPLRYYAGEDPRALHQRKAQIRYTRPEVDPRDGPEAVPQNRLVIEVVNFDTFSSGYSARVGSRKKSDVLVEAIKRYGPEVVVVDESHKIKSPSSNISKFMHRLDSFVPRRIILTGTVMPASPMDVFGQWRFLDPYAFGEVRPDGSRKEATIGGFKARYAKMGGFMGREVVGYHRLDEMQKIMAKNAVVVRKKDALDLPATTSATLSVNLSPKEKKAYNEMKKDLATKLEANNWASSSNVLTQMMRLRQITSGHIPDDQGQVQVIGKSKVNTIVSHIQDVLTEEKRIVVFCLFTKEIAMLREALSKDSKTEVQVITGGTPGPERLAIRQRFGSSAPERIVLVAQIKTISLAVNELVTANHAIFGSMSQQRDDYIQAKDRLDRIGQTRPVTFWHAVAPGTIDEVILKSHDERTDLENAMLRHIQGGDI